MMRRPLKTLIMATLVILASAVAVEGLLRLACRDGVVFELEDQAKLFPWLQGNAVLGWWNRAGYAHRDFSIDARHFRGPEIEMEKPAGTTRILALGDSRTFGVRSAPKPLLRFDGTYVPQLENALEARATGPVEVLNGGVVGYTSAHVLRQLNTTVPPLHPDIVIVGVGFNDLLLSWDPGMLPREPRSPTLRTLLYRLYDLRLVQMLLRAIQKDPTRGAPLSERWVSLEQYRENLERIVDVAQESGVRILFLHQPLRALRLGPMRKRSDSDVDPNPIFYFTAGVDSLEKVHELSGRYRDVLFDVASDRGVPLVDLEPIFAPRAEEVFGDLDLVHYNELGAQLAGKALADRLVELGWIETGPPAEGAPPS